MNSSVRCDELLLAALRFLGLGQDVDVPAGELRGEPHVLAAAADGERELVVRHDDLDAVGVLVEHDLGDLGRLQRVDDEGRRCPADHGMMSIFSPCSSPTTACTREPRMPTQAPTGSIEESREITAILAREPGSRATAFISTMPS